MEVPHETHKVILVVYDLRQDNVSCDRTTLGICGGGRGHRRVDSDRPALFYFVPKGVNSAVPYRLSPLMLMPVFPASRVPNRVSTQTRSGMRRSLR